MRHLFDQVVATNVDFIEFFLIYGPPGRWRLHSTSKPGSHKNFLKCRQMLILPFGATVCAERRASGVTPRFSSRFTRIQSTEAVREFLEEQHRFQTRITASLHASPEVGVQASPDHIKHNQALVAALDWMSLEICWGVTREKKIPGVPVVWGRGPQGGAYLLAARSDHRGDGTPPWPDGRVARHDRL
jgi:hypothetical protein